jgi:NTE family protein
MTKSLARETTFALALGGGGARGLAHIAVLEALDEMGRKPVAIAGTSVGALIGAAYAAGMSGKQIRRFVIRLAHNRAEVFRRLIATRAGTFANLFSMGFGSATLVDAEKFCRYFLPDDLPEHFDELEIPLTIIATDLYRQQQAVFSSGKLRPALAASIALPTVMRPVIVNDRILIDGAATNPLPFDHLGALADIVVAVDISGEPAERRDIPSPWECLLTTVLVMGNAITAEKVKHGPPDLIVRPKVGSFRALDFLQASAILRAAEPVKAEVKDKLTALLDR